MANPARGVVTDVTWDADGSGSTSTPTDVQKGSTFEYEEETTTEEQGPFFNEPAVTEIATGDKYSMKLSLVVPEGGDPGQTALQTARANKQRGTLVVDTVLGKKITMTNALVKKISYKGEAKGVVTMDVEVSGIGAVAAGSTS